ncbi:MAG: tRNA (adenosine(37)-N6)-dimethylallyltransferase MiaA [Clostridiales bacterium]|jgi:tRNA dimethylallyltransferase|nr:tRNA (adenosine(37)-N6)-dimethylallyltransferase MiaA [Clostridiales bacterium]
MTDIPKVIAVTGPTATGKSELAIELARRFDGEIISCDSMQIYKDMDIGTAKLPPRSRKRITHHMIDIIEPEASFSCSDYAAMAAEAADAVISRGRIPIFCGGTGLYLDSVISPDRYPEQKTDPVLRRTLDSFSDEELISQLRNYDPLSAETVDLKNRRRIIRALELYFQTGITKTEWDARSKKLPPKYAAVKLGLDYKDRQTLYDRIDARVERMFEEGLAEEAKSLYKRELSATARQAIGYKELFSRIESGEPPENAKDAVKQATRRYAKRQLTWFRRDPDAVWLEAGSPGLAEHAAEIVMAFLAGR